MAAKEKGPASAGLNYGQTRSNYYEVNRVVTYYGLRTTRFLSTESTLA
jgi:hypothetical protein